MKVIFITPYPTSVAASQRFRFEQYYSLLKENQIDFVVAPFITEKVWSILYKKGFWWKKSFSILLGFVKRYGLLFRIRKYDYVFIHREAVPLGPPIWEFIVAKVIGKKIIYDFNDAIWLHNASETNRLFSYLKWYSNVQYLCRIAYKVSCGNNFLRSFSSQYNNNSVYNPTTIDTENYHSRIKKSFHEPIVIGWTGSHSTLKYIDAIIPVLKQLERKYDFTFMVISDVNPNIPLTSFVFKEWNRDTEIDDLLKIDIGIMPLVDDKWSNGKCGFKALQYMSLGIPALVSAVGVNTKIVDDGVSGFVCNTESDWEQYLEKFILEPQLLVELGKNTRKKIINDYSVSSNSSNFIHLFS